MSSWNQYSDKPFYAEQNMMGEKVKYKGKIFECIPGEKITMKFKLLSRTIFNKQNIRLLNDMNAHVRTQMDEREAVGKHTP